jgi:catechol 2,3-dioxygenase-like lactoylglutathione lyase family enzyme
VDDSGSQATRPAIRFGSTVLDTPDPKRLSRFYAELLGWAVDPDDDSDDWVTIRSASGTELMFQLASESRAPTWPDPEIPQQFHLDFMVDDLDAAQAFAESLGATRRQADGEAKHFRVFLDPSGHPFCLCQARLTQPEST